MQTGENRALRWLVHEREGEPVPLHLYRIARRMERMTPDQRDRLLNDMDTRLEFRNAAGVTGMSTKAAIDAGLLTKADVWALFGMVPAD